MAIKRWTLNIRVKKTLPGLGNFYTTGLWVEPGGGILTVVMSGRNVTQLICKKDKKAFNRPFRAVESKLKLYDRQKPDILLYIL